MSKKTFKHQLPEFNNPAMQFISQNNAKPMDVNVANLTPNQSNEMNKSNGVHTNPINKAETRDKRLQDLLQPSLYQTIKHQANSQQRSVNDLIHEVLSTYFKQ